jgi:hypothetical protein
MHGAQRGEPEPDREHTQVTVGWPSRQLRLELGAWRLLVPHSAGHLTHLLDDCLDLWHVIVLLDELQELLDQPNGPVQLCRFLALRGGPTALCGSYRRRNHR